MHETAVPVVPVDGHVMDAESGSPAMDTVAVWLWEAGGDAESVPVTMIVWEPLVE